MALVAPFQPLADASSVGESGHSANAESGRMPGTEQLKAPPAPYRAERVTRWPAPRSSCLKESANMVKKPLMISRPGFHPPTRPNRQLSGRNNVITGADPKRVM